MFEEIIKFLTSIDFLYSILVSIGIIIVMNYIYKLIDSFGIKKMKVEYIREITDTYSLPIVYSLSGFVSNSNDLILATILKLENLDIVTIEKENNKISISSKSTEKVNELSIAEKYIYDWLVTENKSNYSEKQLQSKVKKEIYRSDLFGFNETRFLVKALISIIPSFLFVYLATSGYITNDFYFQIMITVFMIFFGYNYVVSNGVTGKVSYTKKGTKEHYKVIYFYNYLRDFTFLHQREVEENILWKDYLMYAVLFGLNNEFGLKNEMRMYTDEEYDRMIKDFFID